jgi:hypothetical protein
MSAPRVVDIFARSARKVMEVALAAVIFSRLGAGKVGSVGTP